MADAEAESRSAMGWVIASSMTVTKRVVSQMTSLTVL